MKSTIQLIGGVVVLLLAGCGDSADNSVEVGIGGASIKQDFNATIEVRIDGKTLNFPYLINCTMSPVMSGVLAYDREPDPESTERLNFLRIAAITEDGNTTAQIEINHSGYGYVLEGPVTIDGKTLSWSGQFLKTQHSETPGPVKKIGEVNGNGSISC